LVYGAIKNENDTEKLLIPIIVQSWIINIYGYYQYIAGRNRISSLLIEANAYGEYLCLLLGATFIVMLRTKKKWIRIFLLATSFAIAIAMVLAQNRGSWIATAFALVVSSILYGRQINFAKLVVPIAIVAIFSSGIVRQRFQQLNKLSESGYSQNTFQGRVETWYLMLKLVPMSPIVGHGIGSSFSIGEKYYGVKIAPHNDYVRIVVESGFPALFIYVGFLLSILASNIIRACRYENWWAHFPMLFVICYWMVISITQNLVSNVSIFPLFMALVAVGDKMAKLEDEATKMSSAKQRGGLSRTPFNDRAPMHLR
jgi:O-antigen ligase